MEKRRYAQVGTGSRALMFTDALATDEYREHSELVGLCDSNAGRLQLRLDWAIAQGFDVVGYASDYFDRMIEERRPDVVIVTTVDQYHDQYICRAMELGCDVITEKPMTTDAAKCQRIIDTQRATGRNVRVTFNYRYSPARTQIKKLLLDGVIGQVQSIDFHWLLDTHHGADYFRRWHRNKINSGGLMVHKATHHFDLVNWWLESVPVSVFANGDRRFYLPETAHQYGLDAGHERCDTCDESTQCPFYLDLRRSDEHRTLYLENEQHDGYFRDRCVFSPEIDIEDTMGVLVEYANGVRMSYSLNAFMPWEGYTIAFNGDKGRLEHTMVETVYTSGDGRVPGEMVADATTIRVCPHFESAYEVDIWQAAGGHGGGDRLLLQDVLDPQSTVDPYGRAADHRGGAYSILTGIAANQSMATGTAIRVSDLVHSLESPFA